METKTQELIIVEQLPVITEKLKVVSDEIDRRIAVAMSLDCTEDSVKEVKKMRAELNGDLKGWEERRKSVKTAIMSPYEQFEDVYKQFVSDKYKDADSALKQRVDAVEDELKQRRFEELKAYLIEYAESQDVVFVKDRCISNIKVTLSASMKSLKKEAKDFIDRVCDDLALIDTQEHKDEILVEYHQTFNCSQAITAVSERHKALAEQEARRLEQEQRKAAEQAAVAKVEEAAPLAPPVEQVAEPVDVDSVKTLAFKVTAPVSKLRELKQFLNDGGYTYE